jgi:H+/Cl- antiporter ClcA
VVTAVVGGVLGAVPAALLVIAVTEGLKRMLAVLSDRNESLVLAVPLLGIGLSVLLLYGLGTGEGAPGDASGSPHSRARSAWRTFPPRIARSDLTASMVAYAGEEERFPWRLAPLRILAIAATVGLGGPMGTEAPAAYIGMATGAAVGDRGRRWRRFLRPAVIGGGAAGVSVLMGMPLIGSAYVLELGRRHGAPLDWKRLVAALIGGLVGWGLNVWLKVDLIRLVVPAEPPRSLGQGMVAALLVGTFAGCISSMTGEAIYRAKAWQTSTGRRFACGVLVLGVALLLLARVAAPSAALGPGGGAISWVETTEPAALTVLAVALLRAVATSAAAGAGGCGGLFVPLLAVGDLAGRVFVGTLGLTGDLAGAAGAACGIAAGYRLPFTAVALVLEQGGPPLATLACLGAVVLAAVTAMGTEWGLDRVFGRGFAAVEKR